jgi:hypothetical protein
MEEVKDDKIRLYGLKDKDGQEYELILLGFGCNWVEVKPIVKPVLDLDTFRYHVLCARATLYPGKTIEEVNTILDKIEEECKKAKI